MRKKNKLCYATDCFEVNLQQRQPPPRGLTLSRRRENPDFPIHLKHDVTFLGGGDRYSRFKFTRFFLTILRFIHFTFLNLKLPSAILEADKIAYIYKTCDLYKQGKWVKLPKSQGKWVNNTMINDEWLRQFYHKVCSIMKSWFKQKSQTSQKIN